MNASLASTDLAVIEAHLRAGRHAEAETGCENILSSQPSNLAARFLRAWAWAQAGRYPQAIGELEAVIAAWPALLPARYLLADIYFGTNRPAQAREPYEHALALEFGIPATLDAGTRMAALLDLIATAPPERWRARVNGFWAYASCLDRSAVTLSAESVDLIAKSSFPLLDDAQFVDRFAAACAVLAVSPHSSHAWMERLYRAILLPWMRRALEADRFGNGLQLENTCYFSFTKQVETEDRFRDSFAEWLGPLREAGRRSAAMLGTPARAAPGKRPRVAYFVHNVNGLAHVKTLLEVLQGHAELAEPMMEPYVFFLAGEQPVVDQFRRAGARTEQLTGATFSKGLDAALMHLRRRVAEEGIEVLAWISLPVMMSFAFAMRIAPRQVWWSMKYHALAFPEIDDYLTGGSQTGGTKEIHGRQWRVGPVAASDWFDPSLLGEARRVRAALGSPAVIYGSFGREEKLGDAEFLDSVANILRENPDSIFLWTGRVQSPVIQKRLEANGIAGRCKFIGWVNTKVYAQVIDVFLDSFPFPCGFTLYEAMAAGKPAVLYDSPESRNGGIHAVAGPLLRADPATSESARQAHQILRPGDAQPLYFRAASAPEYVRMATRLGRDIALRELAGMAARDFIEKVMMDRRASARIYLSHLLGRDSAAVVA